MLYATTRNEKESYTANRAWSERRSPDGGLYIPHRLIPFSLDEIQGFAQMSFSQSVAYVLNHFFQTRFHSWDIDLGIGRHPVRLEAMNHRIVICETWHNLRKQFSGLTLNIKNIMESELGVDQIYGPWLEVAVRISVLFGVFGELFRSGIAGINEKIDISLVGGDFFGPVAVWYAREMGLPIENIVCCCNENASVWDLFTHGQFRTDGICITTQTPAADIVIPEGLEYFIYLCCGSREVSNYLNAVQKGGMYFPETAVLERLRNAMQVQVISADRMLRTIPSVWGTHRYILSPYTALAYAGLLDYRAGVGESRYGLVFADVSPEIDCTTVSGALGISEKDFEYLIKTM